MDCLPLIPENEESHDVFPIICKAFQRSFITDYPENVAENLQKYQVDTIKGNLRTTSAAIFKVCVFILICFKNHCTW